MRHVEVAPPCDVTTPEENTSSDVFARPSQEEPRVRALLAGLGVRDDVSTPDLGGTMSLNLHLVSQGLVLRVHPRFVTRERVLSVQGIRNAISEAGLVVGEPRQVDGEAVLDLGDWLAEVETFVAHSNPPPTWESYVWMFGAMGALHRVLRDVDESVPEPVVATYGPPAELRRWMKATTAAVAHDTEGARTAAWINGLVERLEEAWVDEADLPSHVVHGDIRLGNVAVTPDGAAAYFDFGFAAARPRIHDLAYSLSWMILRPDGKGRAEDFTWDRVSELLDSYQESTGEALQPNELVALKPYLAAVPLYLAAIASYLADPVAHLEEEAPFVRVAEWVLANP